MKLTSELKPLEVNDIDSINSRIDNLEILFNDVIDRLNIVNQMLNDLFTEIENLNNKLTTDMIDTIQELGNFIDFENGFNRAINEVM